MIPAALVLRLVRALVPVPYPGETPDGYRQSLHDFVAVPLRPPVFTERPTQ